MKKMSRYVAILLVLAMFASVFVGCVNNEKPSGVTTGAPEVTQSTNKGDVSKPKVNKFGWEIPEETLTIHITDLAGNFNPTESFKIGLKNMQDYLLKEFNVVLDYTWTNGDGGEAQNLALASGDYAEVVTGISYSTAQKFRDQGRAINVAPYIDSVGTDLKRVMGNVYDILKEDNGEFYMIPRNMGCVEELPDNCAALRYDEYLEIGSPKIETPDDYYNVLKTILEKHPTNANGEKRYALSLYNTDYPMELGGYWGLKQGWLIDENDEFTHWAFTDEGMEMTKWFNQIYRDGNLDPDAFINTFDDWGAKFASERIVGHVGQWWTTYNKGHEVWEKTDENHDPNKHCFHVGFKSPNVEHAYLNGKMHLGGDYTVITTKAENPEAIMKLINFMATDVGLALFAWGIPGGVEDPDNPGTIVKTWDLHDDGTWEFDEKAKSQYIDGTWDYSKEPLLGNIGLNLFRDVSRWDDGIHCIWPNQCWYEEDKWKSMMIENLQGTFYDATPLFMLEKSPEFIMLESAVKDAWAQNWPGCVQSNSDEELQANWEKMQNDLKAAGVDQYTEAVQANYQSQIARFN